MLDRDVVEDLLKEELKERGIRVPKGIFKKTLTETFCRYTEDDYYEWLKDNFQSFFNDSVPDWDWIKERIEHYKRN
ncbi:MAG: hypothetical protein FJZ11_00620 [Candidatus Omnitrophica bacterium]|nr:hypothetical protein [Candidatus Omnitrophota bacterium]